MVRMGLSPSFGTQRRILESPNNPSMQIVKKDLRQESLRLKAEQAQQPQGYLAVNSTSEDSRRRKREKVWCEHCSISVTTRNPQSCYNKPKNPGPRWHRARFDNVPSPKENSETFSQEGQTNNEGV